MSQQTRLNFSQILGDLPASRVSIAVHSSVNRVLQDALDDFGINIKDHGAKVDGVTDDTLAWRSAIQLSESMDLPIYFPSGTSVVTDELVFTLPPQIRGGKYSPPVIGKFNNVPYAQKGSVLLSKVTTGRTISINPPSNNQYIRGCWLLDFHVLADASTGRNGSGVLIANCGWGGYIRGLVVEGFQNGGVELSQLQDTLLDQLEVLDCGTDNGAAALEITNGTNLCVFNRVRVEANFRQMRIRNSLMLEFHGSHFEQGDYPGSPMPEFEKINRFTSIQLTTCDNIKFIGGNFFGATMQKQMAKFGITASQCPFHMSVGGDCSNIDYIGATMGFGYNSGRILEHHGSGRVLGCTFLALCTETYALYLDGNILFSNNSVAYTDNPTSDTFTLMYAAYATVKDNIFTCPNGSSVDKPYGSLFTVNSSKPMRLGNNQYIISKRPRFFDGIVHIVEQSRDGYEQSAGGVVNMQQYNPNSIINLFGGAGGAATVTSIDNVNTNQDITFCNNGTGNITINHGGNIACKGSVPAVIPAGGFIKFMHNGNSGVSVEIARY